MNHPQTGLTGKDYEGYCKEIMSTLPEISALSDEIETKGLIPDEILQWMYEMKIFKFFVPIELGGKMAPLPAALRVYEALAAVDGNIGWLAQIGAGGGYFVPSFTHEVAKEFFSNPRAVIAGTGYPAGEARPVPGGYRVKGHWKYASGSQYATLYTANAVLLDERKDSISDSIRAFAFYPDQVRIIEDWQSFGLKGTSSHSFVVEDLFVPEERSFVVGEIRWNLPDPLYRFPFSTFAEVSVSSVCIGLARGFFDRLSEMNHDDRHPADVSMMAERMIRLRGRFFREVDDAWEVVVKGETLQEEKAKRVGKAAKEAAQEMRCMVQEIFPKLGMSVLRENHPLNRIYRDLETACHHVSIQDE